jgi:hypothetical protein
MYLMRDCPWRCVVMYSSVTLTGLTSIVGMTITSAWRKADEEQWDQLLAKLSLAGYISATTTPFDQIQQLWCCCLGFLVHQRPLVGYYWSLHAQLNQWLADRWYCGPPVFSNTHWWSICLVYVCYFQSSKLWRSWLGLVQINFPYHRTKVIAMPVTLPSCAHCLSTVVGNVRCKLHRKT